MHEWFSVSGNARALISWRIARLILLFAGLQILATNIAQAQKDCAECRASIQYGRCEQSVVASPPAGTIGVIARVLEFEHGECRKSKLRMEIISSTNNLISGVIELSVSGRCVYWLGERGVLITGLVRRIDGAYSGNWGYG